MKKEQWKPYQNPLKEEQQIFQDLLGNALHTEALLVSKNEQKGHTEYIFLYNHPDDSNHNLVSFYAKVATNKELLKIASAQLTDKMILRHSKEINSNFALTRNVIKSIGLKYVPQISYGQQVLTPEQHSHSSQATYFFDCDGKGIESDGTINEKSKKGSFCCIIQKAKDYYVLTAAHNLQNGNKAYKLIKDAENVVDLTFAEYCKDVYDAAILKIETPMPSDLWHNRISFSSVTDPEDKILVLVAGQKQRVIESTVVDSDRDATPYHFGLGTGGDYGMSGGPVFDKNNDKTLYGMYLGTGDTACVKYSKIANENGKISKEYILC